MMDARLSLSTQQALLLLGAHATEGEEELMERLEEAVFSDANYFMRRPFVPQLARARCKHLAQLEHIGLVLGLLSANEMERKASPEVNAADIEIHEGLTLLAMMEAYHRTEAKLKQVLSACTHPTEAMRCYVTWVRVFLAFARQFCGAFALRYHNPQVVAGVRMGDTIAYNDLKTAWNPGLTVPSDIWLRYYSRLMIILSKETQNT